MGWKKCITFRKVHCALNSVARVAASGDHKESFSLALSRWLTELSQIELKFSEKVLNFFTFIFYIHVILTYFRPILCKLHLLLLLF
jgi:hypothetical protein